MSEQDARERRVALALASPAAFGEIYMRPFDDEWTGDLPLVCREMLLFAETTRRGVVICPPEFLKTTVISQVYPLWLTVVYAMRGQLALLHGALMSEYQDLAERNLSVVAWHIENNDLIARDFVDVHGRRLLEPDPEEDKWTDRAIVCRRPGASKDPTWQAAGINTQIQGARLRHLIGDDIVTPLSANSAAKQREAIRTWDQQATTRLVEGGQAIVAGNFNHSKDLVSTIANRPRYRVLRRPSLHKPGIPWEAPDDPRDPDAVEAIPEKWPRRRLLEELSEKPASFPLIHLLRSSTAGGALLRDAWVTKIAMAEIPRLSRRYVFGLDPAPGAEVDPDPSFFTITVAILTPKHLDIIESYAARMEPTEQAELLADKVQAYERSGHVAGIGISKIALDRYARGAFIVGAPHLRPLLHEHSIPGDKIERLAHLGPYFKSGWARVTEHAWLAQTADPDDRQQETSLAEEWTSLPLQRHDDRLDGVDLLIREARWMGFGPGQQAAVTTAENGDRRQTEAERIAHARWS